MGCHSGLCKFTVVDRADNLSRQLSMTRVKTVHSYTTLVFHHLLIWFPLIVGPSKQPVSFQFVKFR